MIRRTVRSSALRTDSGLGLYPWLQIDQLRIKHNAARTSRQKFGPGDGVWVRALRRGHGIGEWSIRRGAQVSGIPVSAAAAAALTPRCPAVRHNQLSRRGSQHSAESAPGRAYGWTMPTRNQTGKRLKRSSPAQRALRSHGGHAAVNAVTPDGRLRLPQIVYIQIMAKLVFGMNQSLDGYVDHWRLRQAPRSSATSSRRLRGRRAVSTVATCMRSCVTGTTIILNGMQRSSPSRRRGGTSRNGSSRAR